MHQAPYPIVECHQPIPFELHYSYENEHLRMGMTHVLDKQSGFKQAAKAVIASSTD